MTTHSSRRINALANGLGSQNYLEVGVAAGDTFRAVTIPTKWAVDPRFRFDYAPLETEKIRFFNVPSDDFFISGQAATPFDIVFLDGLHTFEQTFRDFCSSLLMTHERSIIILDDTIPSDIYSSLPDINLAIQSRQRAGLKGRAWHGDVFKMIFAVHDFFPMLSYATVATGGNPQTIVWRERRSSFKPLFNSLEAISRLSFFDLHKYQEFINKENEEELIEKIVGRLK